MLKIEKGIPVSERAGSRGRGRPKGVVRATIASMDVGDSFIAGKDSVAMRQGIYIAAKRESVQIATRKQEDGFLRVWRTA